MHWREAYVTDDASFFQDEPWRRIDYNVISSEGKSTMPNRLIVKQLREQAQGRLIIMNEHDLFYDTDDEIPLTGPADLNERRVICRILPDYAASHPRIPVGGRGYLTNLVDRAVCQDLARKMHCSLQTVFPTCGVLIP
ncbi:hypothetical protein LOC68_08530 [Blastopirellula sp. JC732]|uniref:Uncharacterized protein n=1 Tax=Blastopirellula sediminis TaxID=2894196 RepID=A0A9X1SIU1_9BACT|nr:hypothetical protein [Blastopirellula sediminis]MCC9608784.1 hypothetical protein [Blastopirellula sediminis]MCC9628439.1 hypothetical protein [Blastopirellula sediminis]